MIKEAEAHAAEDAKFRELVNLRNQGDALVHATEKSLKDLGDKVPPEERAKVESAISELKEALKGDSKTAIEAKLQALSAASAGLAQKVYGDAQQASGGGRSGDDNVVDAEFEEVKNDEQKSA